VSQAPQAENAVPSATVRTYAVGGTTDGGLGWYRSDAGVPFSGVVTSSVTSVMSPEL